MFCRKCGNQIENDSSFCKYCGSTVNSIMTPPMQGNVGGVNLDNYIVNNHNSVNYRMEDEKPARKKFGARDYLVAVVIVIVIFIVGMAIGYLDTYTKKGFNLNKLGTVSKHGNDDLIDAEYRQWNNIKYADKKCKVTWHAFCLTSSLGYTEMGTLDMGFGQECEVLKRKSENKTLIVYNNTKRKTCVEVSVKGTLTAKEVESFAKKYLSFY